MLQQNSDGGGQEQQASACLPCRRGRVQLPRRPPAGRNVHRSHSGGQACREGVTLADFSGGRAKQEGSYGQLAWNGELYHALHRLRGGLHPPEPHRAGRRHPPSEHLRRLHRGRRRHGVRLLRGL